MKNVNRRTVYHFKSINCIQMSYRNAKCGVQSKIGAEDYHTFGSAPHWLSLRNFEYRSMLSAC